MAKFWTCALLLGASAAIAAATPLAAQEDVPIAAGQAWDHGPSGISVPATIDGIARARLVRFAEHDLDSAASYFRASPKDVLTVYIFRNTNGSAPIWLSQAQWSIETGTSFGTPSLAIAPASFAPTAQSGASGVHAVYSLNGTEFRSAGVAIFPVGDWYVKIRATSATHSPQQMAAWMTRAIGAIRLPAHGRAAAAVPVMPCTTPLPASATSDSAATAGAGITRPGERIVADRWCRDAQIEGNQTVYRPVGTNDRYLLAMGDNGNAVSVRGEQGYFSETYVTAGMSFALPPQSGLPSPRRVLDLIAADKAVGVFETWPPQR